MKHRLSIILASLVIVVSVSSASVLVKLVTTPASVTAFWRILIALIIITIYYSSKSLSNLKIAFKPSFRFGLSSLAGVFLALHFYTWMNSLKIIEVYLSTTIVCLHPLITMVLSRLILGEEQSSRATAGLVLAVTGSMLIALSKSSRLQASLQGVLLSLIGALFMSSYVMISRYARREAGLAEHVIPAYLSSTLTLLLISLIEGSNVLRIRSVDYLWLTALAIGPMIGGHTLLNYLLKYLSASTASLPIVLEPLGASILALIVLRESIPSLGFIGVALTTIGLFVIAGDLKQAKRT